MVTEGDPSTVEALASYVSHVTAGHRVLAITGELDSSTSGTADEHVGAALRADDAPFVLDLSGVTFLGSAGLSVVAATYVATLAQQRTFHVVASTPSVLRPLEITGLLTEMSVHPTVAEATAS